MVRKALAPKHVSALSHGSCVGDGRSCWASFLLDHVNLHGDTAAAVAWADQAHARQPMNPCMCVRKKACSTHTCEAESSDDSQWTGQLVVIWEYYTPSIEMSLFSQTEESWPDN